MIVDTSALVAILFREPEEQSFLSLIHEAHHCVVSVANWVELFLVVQSQLGSEAVQQCDLFLHRAGISIEPVTLEQGCLARQAFLDFGKGRHPAGLNFGDCFAYALAKERNQPLLFKGGDFRRTDIRAVVANE